jgi:hypothetical protein
MRRTLLLGILLGILISAVAAVTLVATLPSDEEIQKMSLEELGLSDLDQDTLFGPILQRFIETYMAPIQERVRDRVVDDVYKSVALAAGLVVLVTAAGVVVISGDSRRRAKSAEAAPPPS